MPLLSVIVPCYNEQEVLPLFYAAVTEVAAGMTEVDWEFVFVNDGSKDKTLPILRELHQKDARVRYVSFSRNFGKEAAMFAGMEAAKGDYVVIMDADLQDPPSLLPEMYKGITEEGFDCVASRRVTRKGEPPIRSLFARIFYRLINRISKTEVKDGARDFRMMTRKMVDAVLSMSEVNRFSKGIFGWVGFDTKWLEYENAKRAAGETKWSFWKLFLYSIDGITAFSTVPLALASVLGILCFFVAFLMILVIILKTLIWGDPVSGWPSLACIIVFVSGIQLLCIGILGQYLSKTYLEAKNRPIYIAKETEEDQ